MRHARCLGHMTVWTAFSQVHVCEKKLSQWKTPMGVKRWLGGPEGFHPTPCHYSGKKTVFFLKPCDPLGAARPVGNH